MPCEQQLYLSVSNLIAEDQIQKREVERQMSLKTAKVRSIICDYVPIKLGNQT